ncbi:hypothetical protein Y1Q_0021638 [Alligator mississippiensis]|uniref:Uncharacterized protein n=1 Tax=Alligator mississippiensis TaxID=8496 RepID=A0A151PAJ0_ALLMI|nr:hypothetical protein Y1Q_0021638 [Alligator mississippiensis]
MPPRAINPWRTPDPPPSTESGDFLVAPEVSAQHSCFTSLPSPPNKFSPTVCRNKYEEYKVNFLLFEPLYSNIFKVVIKDLPLKPTTL